MSAIYLDNSATTGVAPACIDAVLHCLRETWGNPSSKHRCGEQAHRVVLEARVRVAASIGATPSEVMFTSGGTENVPGIAALGAACAEIAATLPRTAPACGRCASDWNAD